MFMSVVKHTIPALSMPLDLISARMLHMDTGERIKQARKELGLTQQEFGKLAGVSKAAVSQWENGSTKPERDALMGLRRQRGISPEWIISGKGEMFESPGMGEVEETELTEAWRFLLDAEREKFLQAIKERADHNKAVMEQLSPHDVEHVTVSVSKERLKKSSSVKPFATRRKKDVA